MSLSMTNDRNVLILNGPFGAGKTTLINIMLAEIFGFNLDGFDSIEEFKRQIVAPLESYRCGSRVGMAVYESDGVKVARLSGGPWLRKIVKDAHGDDGLTFAENHTHPWVENGPRHNHEGFDEKSHKQFTILHPSVLEEDFTSVGGAALEAADSCNLVVVETGTGLPQGNQEGLVYSSELLLETWRERGVMSYLRDKIIGVVGINLAWQEREARNELREVGADGISASFRVPREAMQKTYQEDFEPWKNYFGELFREFNNTEGFPKMREFVKREVFPLLEAETYVSLEGGKRGGKETF